MEGVFIKHAGAFYPLDDDTIDRFRRIKEGRGVVLSFKEQRNVRFLRKYFALINTAWAYLTETQEAFYGNKEAFRKTVQIAAGYYEPVFDLTNGDYLKSPKSIAFGKMTEQEFHELYEGVCSVLFRYVLKDITREEFDANLSDF